MASVRRSAIAHLLLWLVVQATTTEARLHADERRRHPAGGTSVQHRSQDAHGNYAFSYDIGDPWGSSNGRWETGDALGNKRGGYTITEADGRRRYVEYVADQHGFRVVVRTNEPGTAASLSGAAVIASPFHDPGSAHSRTNYDLLLSSYGQRRRRPTQQEIDYAPLIAVETKPVLLAAADAPAFEPIRLKPASSHLHRSATAESVTLNGSPYQKESAASTSTLTGNYRQQTRRPLVVAGGHLLSTSSSVAHHNIHSYY